MHDLFDTLLGRISPTERELDAARQHRDAVAGRIRLEGVRELINGGSYIKGTSIRPFGDIDLFVGFNAEEYGRDEERVITRLHYHLGQSFPQSEVRLQTHSVGVIFADGFRVDAVPGFAVPHRPDFYRVRDRDDGQWVTTNIRMHKAFFQARQERDSRFRDMVRLVKHWKAQRRRKYSSFLMELLVARASSQGIPHGKDIALHEFFAWIAEGGLREPIMFDDFHDRGSANVFDGSALVVLDPANPNNNIARAVDRDALNEFVSAADWARARSATALVATSRKESAAIWRTILPAFPVV